MAKISWVAESVPEGMAIRQVYCIMLDRDGRVMLRVERKPDRIKYSLAGGRPEVFDNGIEGTCRRELLEEVNTEIETPVYIGYQLVSEENGTPAYAQVRRHLAQGGLAHQQSPQMGQGSFPFLRILPVKAVAHDILQHRIAQKLQPLVVLFPYGRVRQGAAKKAFVAE